MLEPAAADLVSQRYARVAIGEFEAVRIVKQLDTVQTVRHFSGTESC